MEKKISAWIKEYRKNPSFDDGDIAEIETHLRDRIQELTGEGFSSDEAFRKATDEFGSADAIGDEMYKTKALNPAKKPSWKQHSLFSSLLPHYFISSFRTIRKKFTYSFINILGLAIGILACSFILYYIQNELSYDRQHPEHEQIYRMVSTWDSFSSPTTSMPVVNRLEADFPQIETLAWVMQTDGLIHFGDARFVENDIYVVPPAFLNMFKFPVISGSNNPQDLLSRPFTVVLTKETAERYFGDQNPVGKTLEVDNQYDVEVTGVVDTELYNSHFTFDMLLSWETMESEFNFSESVDDQWGMNIIYTYMKLQDQSQAANLEEEFPSFAQKHAGENWNSSVLTLQPVADIHLYSSHNSELSPNSNIRYVQIFAMIALGILLIACINFINIATARATERAGEIGVRKTLGANRFQLIRQFMLESLIMSTLAYVLSAFSFFLLLPFFETLSGISIIFNTIDIIILLCLMFGFSIIIGLLAGIVPAIILSGFKAAQSVKGMIHSVTGGGTLRKTLVVIQFSISVVLIIGTLMVHNQLEYLQSVQLGFDEEQIIAIPMTGGSDIHLRQFNTFKQSLLQYPDIESIAMASTGLPSELLDGTGIGFRSSSTARDSLHDLRLVAVSHDFFATLGVNFIAGRSYDENIPADSGRYIINKSAFELLSSTLPDAANNPDQALGNNIQGWNNFPPTGELIGVTDDFHMSSLHERVEPILFLYRPGWFNNYLIRVNTSDLNSVVSTIEDSWLAFYPEWPFDFQFVDSAFDNMYRNEERIGRIFFVFSILAILVACMGLFGLAAFMARKRMKEIGIRKILGAQTTSIIYLLTGDFLKLIFISFFIAFPLSWYLVSQWLNTFAYRVSFSATVFLITISITLLIALLTVSYQAVKTAFINPVHSLRSE